MESAHLALSILRAGQAVFAGHDNVGKNQVKGLRFGEFQRAGALSHTVASCPSRRNARESEAGC